MFVALPAGGQVAFPCRVPVGFWTCVLVDFPTCGQVDFSTCVLVDLWTRRLVDKSGFRLVDLSTSGQVDLATGGQAGGLPGDVVDGGDLDTEPSRVGLDPGGVEGARRVPVLRHARGGRARPGYGAMVGQQPGVVSEFDWLVNRVFRDSIDHRTDSSGGIKREIARFPGLFDHAWREGGESEMPCGRLFRFRFARDRLL